MPWISRTPRATRGLTGVDAVRSAYDRILNADFADLEGRLADTCGPAPREACHTLEAAGVWSRIALESESRAQDAARVRLAARAIDAADSWTARDPQRADAWFYLGASRAVRAQWRARSPSSAR